MRGAGRQQDRGRAAGLHRAQAALNLFNNSDTNEYQWRRFLRKADFGNRGSSGSLGTNEASPGDLLSRSGDCFQAKVTFALTARVIL